MSNPENPSQNSPGATAALHIAAGGHSGLTVRNLTVRTKKTKDAIVEGINLRVPEGRILGLVGESGSGKSTVGVALLGLARRGLEISSGQVLVGDLDIAALDEKRLVDVRGRMVAYVPQDPASGLNPAMRVGAQLREVLQVHPGALTGSQSDHDRIMEVLEEVGLPATDRVLASFPHQLSGGQQQRIGIAMAIVARPRLVVFDEPTTGLDVTTQKRVLQTIRDLTDRHKMMSVYVSHDLAVVADLADETAVLYAGRLAEQAPTTALFSSARHPYTAGLIASAPSSSRAEVLLGIPGRPPRPGRWPVGCAFAPRCERSQDDCTIAQPPLAEIGPDHYVACLHPESASRAQAHNPAVPDVTPLDRPGLQVGHLDAYYGSAQVLHDVSFTLPAGECVAIVGESGSGKTTLSRCLAGLHTTWRGEVTYNGDALNPQPGRRTQQQRQEIQYIFQNPFGSLNPKMSVSENLEEPLRHFTNLSRGDRQRQVLETLEAVALSDRYANLMPDQLSGGERQRVAVGRSLTIDPTLLVCDEVTSALDVSVQALLVEQLRQLQAERQLSMVFVTHNLAVVRSIAQRVVVLSEGRVVEQGDVEDVLVNPQHPYTQQLLADVPDIEHKRQAV